MKAPRDVSGDDLIKRLRVYGYVFSRQKGSHVVITTPRAGGHSVVVPLHNPIRVGTLTGIVRDVAEHFGVSRDDVLETLFE